VQPDPLGFEALMTDGPSTFGYAGQNPIVKTDPTGTIVPIIVGIGAGIVIDAAIDEFKSRFCGCQKSADPTEWAAMGGAEGLFGPFADKWRTGISGGGPAGGATSWWSRGVTSLRRNDWINQSQKNFLRGFGRGASRGIPWLGAGLLVFDLSECFQ
jgi:hypothetical protein